MPNARIILGYDGTDFFGSQAQPGVRTVQGELDQLLGQLASGSGRTAFAGRTDRGVHALGQVASVQCNWGGEPEALRFALNRIGPTDISVRDVAWVDDAFHARYSAWSREYRYRIVVDDVPPLWERRFVWWRRSGLDSVAIQQGCERLIGRHGFGSFAGDGHSLQRPIEELQRIVNHCSWWVDEVGREHELRIVSNGFLPHMVRNIMGALVQIGLGAQAPEWIDELLVANDRRVLGEAAPPQGLTLWQVRYPPMNCDATEHGGGARWSDEELRNGDDENLHSKRQ